MEQKTKVDAENGKQELTISREFDLPVELLFRAYTEPELLEQWMGTKVLKLENKKHGGWQIETRDARGNVAFRACGAIHEFIPNRKITRTFEMENTPFDAQLEFLEFDRLTGNRSRITIQALYRSVAARDQVLALPFARGITMAHHRLEEIAGKLK
jgi:uncharacterized protein YndB with AHSA1/START domain